MDEKNEKLQQIILGKNAIIKEYDNNIFQLNILYAFFGFITLGIFVALFVKLDEVTDCDGNKIIKENAKNGHKNTIIVGIVASVIAFLISIFIFYYLFSLTPTTST
jgi:ABC-type Fe3+ transport system permease subunit